MALVLVIDSNHQHEQALERLMGELAGREVLVASSTGEALDLIEQSIPDLVIFPLTLAPSEERTLGNRLRLLAGKDPVQTLAMPLLACEERAGDQAIESRWFYWFKPQVADESAQPLEPRSFAKEVRLSLRRGHKAKARSLRARRMRQAIPSAAASIAAASAAVLAAFIRVFGALIRGMVGALGKSAAFGGTRIWPALVSAARSCARMIGRTVTIVWQAARRAGGIEVPGTRPIWYGGPAVALGLVVALTVGIPRAKAWLTTETGRGVADLQSVPSGSEVFIDGKKIGITPFVATLAPGRYDVEFRYAGATKTAAIDVVAGGRADMRVDWKRAAAGHLRVTSDPEGAAVMVDGTKRGFTPITLDDLAAGQHVVTLQHPSGFVRRVVKIKPNETAVINESIYSGWLALFAPIEVEVSERGRRLRLDEQNQVMLSPGRHDLQLANSAVGYIESRIVEVKPGEVTALTIAIPKTPVTVTATSSAEVWVDGVKIGETPIIDAPIDVGTREFVLKSSTLGERRVMTTVTVKPSHVNIDFSKPDL